VERSEYDKLDSVEDRMWWFAAMHRNLLTISRQLPLETVSLPVLDAGCGTGRFLARLAGTYPQSATFGIDVDPQTCARAVVKSVRPVCAGSVNDLPIADGALAAIFSADVLCHAGVNEGRALWQFHRCLAENGWLILNLPAYRWMLSRHDAAVHNVRRYTANRLRNVLRAVGFRLIYVSYWNTMLFPLMVITRKLALRSHRAASDVSLYPRAIDVLCRLATRVETALLRAGMRFPFGGSVIAIAAKGGVADD
jgi:SAM-dependent methyltransferase